MYLFILKINFANIVTQFPDFTFFKYILLSYYHNKCITIVLYLLTENSNREQENAPKQNNNFPKLPQLYVVLQRIDEVSKEETMKISRKPSKKRRKLRIELPQGNYFTVS